MSCRAIHWREYRGSAQLQRGQRSGTPAFFDTVKLRARGRFAPLRLGAVGRGIPYPDWRGTLKCRPTIPTPPPGTELGVEPSGRRPRWVWVILLYCSAVVCGGLFIRTGYLELLPARYQQAFEFEFHVGRIRLVAVLLITTGNAVDAILLVRLRKSSRSTGSRALTSWPSSKSGGATWRATILSAPPTPLSSGAAPAGQ
jgi:hypothetical protein